MLQLVIINTTWVDEQRERVEQSGRFVDLLAQRAQRHDNVLKYLKNYIRYLHSLHSSASATFIKTDGNNNRKSALLSLPIPRNNKKSEGSTAQKQNNFC